MSRVPAWLDDLLDRVAGVRGEELTRFLPPDDGGRQAAVLILFGEGPRGRDLLLIERAHDMRSHAGQPAFPGGGIEPGDADAAAAALREAEEETGLDPSGVDVVGLLPQLYLPPSGYVVTPVLGWWRRPTEIFAKDPLEVAAVHRVSLAELTDPASRYRVRHPSGWIGPAFGVHGMVVWGFTAGLLDRLIAIAGWERSWDTGRVEELPMTAVRGSS